MPLKSIKKILITAGPTREMLDPVRFLSNLSTGEMGYALARAAVRRGYGVTLVSGPVAIKPDPNIRFVPVMSAFEMQKACERLFPSQDALIMSAAVCDFTAAKPRHHKIHRTRTKTFLLKQTPDIVAGLARKKGRRIVVGFCLETENWLSRAKEKMNRKRLDGIVANYYGKGYVPFGKRPVTVGLIDAGGRVKILKNLSKSQLSENLLSWLDGLAQKKQ